MAHDDDDPACEESGFCVATRSDRARGHSMCRHCGKTLVLSRGQWLTWDHEDQRHPEPQREED